MGMTENRWWSYIEKTLGGMSALEAGRRAGFDSSAFTRWKKGARPDIEFVVKFARAFGRPVVEAIAEAGFITDDEAGLKYVTVGTQEALAAADPRSLVEEVFRRMTEAK